MSKSEMTVRMFPSDANPSGNVFGGYILKQIDLVAGLVAQRHAQTNAVTASKAFINTVTINIPAGSQQATATVETGSAYLGFSISNAGAINGTTLMNTVSWSDPTATVSISGTDGTKQTSFDLNFLRPTQ